MYAGGDDRSPLAGLSGYIPDSLHATNSVKALKAYALQLHKQILFILLVLHLETYLFT